MKQISKFFKAKFGVNVQHEPNINIHIQIKAQQYSIQKDTHSIEWLNKKIPINSLLTYKQLIWLIWVVIDSFRGIYILREHWLYTVLCVYTMNLFTCFWFIMILSIPIVNNFKNLNKVANNCRVLPIKSKIRKRPLQVQSEWENLCQDYA